MIVDERFVTYINALNSGNTALLDEIEAEALRTDVPVIRKETQACLKLFLALKRPARILEVGTAVGFSAILMKTYNPAECKITTIENYDKRIPIARENFRRAGMEQEIELIEGDAAKVLQCLAGPYDMIFMDAAKGQYIHFLPHVLRLLEDGGMLISDNILQDGDIIESRYAVIRRNRTIHRRMRSYLYELTHHEQLVTAVLPVGDGITVSSKKGAADCKKQQ
ncbi:MAG: O-methyltransferase [Eubacterium sp.]|nr:O-methyltransferase [Eubacterium sp.]